MTDYGMCLKADHFDYSNSWSKRKASKKSKNDAVDLLSERRAGGDCPIPLKYRFEEDEELTLPIEWIKALESDVSDKFTHLNEMLADLSGYNVSDIYDVDFLKPTEYSSNRTITLLREVAMIMGNDLPLGDLFPDGTGGIRIEWSAANHAISLMIPSDQSGQDYLYHGEPETYGVQYNVTPQKITEHLLRLIEDE